MTDEKALLATILAEPDDDAPRLVYADWLSENRIGEAGARALAGSSAFPQLRSLYLRSNPIGDAGKAALLDRFGAAVHLG
jgi:uncharacterized protein (TIGR02996 family)